MHCVHSGRRLDVETYTVSTRRDRKTVSYNRVNEVNDLTSEWNERLLERAQRVSPQANEMSVFTPSRKKINTLLFVSKKVVFLHPQKLTTFNKPKKLKIMLNQYETVFIMTPVLSDDQMKETVKKFENILTSNGAELVHEEDWGLRKFEYPIQKKSSGFYHLFEFKAEGAVVKELELQYRRDERVLRYLTVAMDKHAIAYSEKRRNLKKEPKAE